MDWRRKLNGRQGKGMGVKIYGKSGGLVSSIRPREAGGVGAIQLEGKDSGQDSRLGDENRESTEPNPPAPLDGIRNSDAGV